MNIDLEEGKKYFKRKEYDQALLCLQRALADEACRGEPFIEMGKIYKERKEYDRAVEMFGKGIAAGFNEGWVHKEFGEAYYLSGRYPEAREELLKAWGEDPGDAWVLSRLGDVYQKQGEYEKAEEMYVKAIEGGLEAAEVYVGLGEICLRKNDYQRAEERFESALKIRPGDRTIVENLLSAYGANGEKEKEKELLGSVFRGNDAEAVFMRNKALNAAEILERKTVLTSRPLKLGVALTEKCNLRCIMCLVKNTKKREIPDHTVEEIIALFPYLQYVQWLGGEAFLSKHFAGLFEKASAFPRLRQSINTNGLLITDEWAKKLVQNGVKLDLSIDGISRETYERIRSGGKFGVLTENLERIKEHREKHAPERGGISVSMNFAVMKSNFHELEKIVGFAYQYRLDSVQLSVLNEVTPEEIVRQEALDSDPEIVASIERVMPEVLREARDRGIILHNRILIHGPRAAAADPASTAPAVPGNDALFCYEPWQSLFIMPGPFGAVRPDCLCLSDIGNITAGSLETLWNGSAMQAYRENIRDATFKGFCNRQCVGGKRPENFISS